MRYRLLLVLVVALAAAAPAPAGARTTAPIAARAQAATYKIDVPKGLSRQIRRAKAADSVPILLPNTVPSEFRRLYPGGGPTADGYSFGMHAARGCNGANACFVSGFTAQRGGK